MMPSIDVSVVQFLVDEENGSAGASGFTILDTEANIVNNLGALNTHSTDITAVQATDQAVTLSALQVFLNGAIASKIDNGFAVSDTGSNIFSFLSHMEPLVASGKLTSIILTDNSTTPYFLGASDFSADSAALALITANYSLWILDAPAADAAGIAGQTHVALIIVSDTAANVAANIAALETLTPVSQLILINVSDTAADVVANIASLETLLARGQPISISLSDGSTPTISLTGGQFNLYSAALSKIQSNYNLSISGPISAGAAASIRGTANVAPIAISDTGLNVLAYLSQIEPLAASGKLTAITLTDAYTSPFPLQAADLSADSTVLDMINGSYELWITEVAAADASIISGRAHVAQVSVFDTAANVSANLASLETLAINGQLVSIGLSDGSTPTISLTGTQLTANSAALSQIHSNYNLSISGTVSIATALSIPRTANVLSIAISDTELNVLSNAMQLETLAASGQLTTITLTDTSTAPYALPAADFPYESAVLALLNGSSDLQIVGVTAANASIISGQAHFAHITVSDTAANVAANFASLETLVAGGRLISIQLSDSSTPTISLTAAQYTGNSAALSIIQSNYSLQILGSVSVAGAASFANNTHVTSILVSDTAANVVGNLSSLETLAANHVITSIALTDSSTPTISLTMSQFNADVYALAAIVTPYNLTISGDGSSAHPNLQQGSRHSNSTVYGTPSHVNDLTHSSSVQSAYAKYDYIDGLNYIASFNDLIVAFGANAKAGQQHFLSYGTAENRITSFDGLDYIASYGDLTAVFSNAGSEQAVQDAGATHYIEYGVHEGRRTAFNGLDYIASYEDLIRAFGADNDAGAYHYIEYGAKEGRTSSFDGLDYVASYGDLINALGANEQAGAAHYIEYGSNEGRSTTFNGLDYIASYSDLIRTFGANNDAGATHYIEYGHNEGRAITFDGLDYIASYGDLINALGVNEQAGALHYINYGSKENRITTFNGLDYIASHSDLIATLGANNDAGAANYIATGYGEGRTTTFDGLAYIANYTDLMTKFGANEQLGAVDYIENGFNQGRSTTFNMASYLAAHSDLIGRYATNDQFLTVYINTYKMTGHFLT